MNYETKKMLPLLLTYGHSYKSISIPLTEKKHIKYAVTFYITFIYLKISNIHD